MTTSAVSWCSSDGPQARQGASAHRGLARTDRRGEAANRLARLDVLAPDGVEWALAVANRNFIIHQYDEIDRELTWLTLSRDLPAWRTALVPLFVDAGTTIEEEPG